MVGLVIVSHSKKIAEGARELSEQMSQGVPIASVGGSKDGRLGTDAEQIVEAINKVYSSDGVIMLYDLGSALMSGDTALEFLDDEKKGNVYISDAPLVEGAVIASVEIGIGKTLDEVKMTLEKMGSKKDWS